MLEQESGRTNNQNLEASHPDAEAAAPSGASKTSSARGTLRTLRTVGALPVVAIIIVIAVLALWRYGNKDQLGQQVPTLDPSVPLLMEREGDGFRIYPRAGGVSFGNYFLGTPWVDPSRLLLTWFPPYDESGTVTITGTLPVSASLYVADLEQGTIRKSRLPLPDSGLNFVPSPNGKQLVLIHDSPIYEDMLRIELSDLDARETQVVFDIDPLASQWAGTDVHQWDKRSSKPSHGFSVQVTWIAEDTFVLTIQALADAEIAGWGTRPKLMLVNTHDRRVQVLAHGGAILAQSLGGALVWQAGWIDGELFMMAPPYNSPPIRLAEAGLWKTDVAAAFNSERVAWFESEAPPGDWSRQLPITCINCVGAGRPADPMPTLKSLAVWEKVIGKVQRFSPPKDAIWRFTNTNLWRSDPLHWNNDNSSLLYAAHIPGKDSDKHTALYRFDMNGQTTKLSDHDWYANLEVLRVAQDDSIYYHVTDPISPSTELFEGAGHDNIWHRYADGKLETLTEAAGISLWTVDSYGRLVALKGRGVVVRDLNSGEVKSADFPRGEFDTGWSGVLELVPLSPDGTWAAFDGSNGDLIREGDRSQEVLIARLK